MSDPSLKPGELIVRTLLAHLTKLSQKKVELVVHEKEVSCGLFIAASACSRPSLITFQEKDMAKLLKRGEDPEFDQLLSALSSCAEHCLPSLLVAMCKWHSCQYSSEVAGRRHTLHSSDATPSKDSGSVAGTLPRGSEKDPLLEKRDVRNTFVLVVDWK